MSNDDNTVEFEDVFVEAETPLAILCEIDGKKCWIPQSQIQADSEVWHAEDQGTLVVTRWWAEKEGLV